MEFHGQQGSCDHVRAFYKLLTRLVYSIDVALIDLCLNVADKKRDQWNNYNDALYSYLTHNKSYLLEFSTNYCLLLLLLVDSTFLYVKSLALGPLSHKWRCGTRYWTC